MSDNNNSRDRFSDAQLMTLMKEHPEYSNVRLGRELEVSEKCIRNRKKRLVAKGFSPDHNYTHLVPDGFVVKGVSQQYKADGSLGQQWVKSSIDRERQLEILTEMCQGFITDLPKIEPITLMNENDIHEDKLAVYPLGDPHVGMHAWAEECGDNWDLKIAEETFCKVFDRVVRTAPRCKTALIVNLGDYFHRDNSAGVTARSGHHLDVDGRFAKMVQVGVKIKRQMIATALEMHEKVHVIILPGNHDDVGSLFLAIALKHIYENEPRVTIDDSPSLFHYFRFGKVLLGAHHGHTCKMEKLPSVMAADKAKDWGDTEFRYWLTGHIHHDSKKEFPGCMVESFRTLAAKDSYAMSGGWRSGRDTKCIVYHKDFGEIERHVVDISQILPR